MRVSFVWQPRANLSANHKLFSRRKIVIMRNTGGLPEEIFQSSRSRGFLYLYYFSSNIYLPCAVELPACCWSYCDTGWTREFRPPNRKDSSDWVRSDSRSRSDATRTIRCRDLTPVSWWGFWPKATGDPRDRLPLAET